MQRLAELTADILQPVLPFAHAERFKLTHDLIACGVKRRAVRCIHAQRVFRRAVPREVPEHNGLRSRAAAEAVRAMQTARDFTAGEEPRYLGSAAAVDNNAAEIRMRRGHHLRHFLREIHADLNGGLCEDGVILIQHLRAHHGHVVIDAAVRSAASSAHFLFHCAGKAALLRVIAGQAVVGHELAPLSVEKLRAVAQ